MRLVIALSLIEGALCAHTTAREAGSAFAGSTSSFEFPPAGVTVTATDTFFPDGSQVGFPGPTPTGDEAQAIATAPVAALVDSVFPLIRPNASNAKSSEFDIFSHTGNLAPWQSVKSFGLPNASPLIPSGCELTQVYLLHRHGARYPTAGSGPANFAGVLQAAVKGSGFSASGPLEFLNTWTYKLGAEILNPFGRSQLYNLGIGFRIKYGDLLKGFKDLPVWRTTSEARMLDSALNFAAGFFGVQTYQQDYHQLVTIEALGQNNTLAPFGNCPNANNATIGGFGGVQSAKWAQVYLKDAVKRLAPSIKGIDLNVTHLIAMQQLCAYETESLGFSKFCDLFTEDEWKGYEYFNDLGFWYTNGPGSPTSSAIGIGWVQELVSRLTQVRITEDNTSVNKTIVSNPVTFPLNQPIYVDASHDNTMAAITVAMNFTSLAANGPLPTDHIPKKQTYFVSQIAPFASNLVGQVLSCPASNSKKPTHIRWILNDGVLPLTGIQGCKPNNDGLCDLQTFIDGMKRRLSEVDFEFSCLGNITVPIPDNIVDGQVPNPRRHG